MFVTCIEKNIKLPKGTKFNANGIIFETKLSFSLLANEIKCLQYFKGTKFIDISHIIEREGNLGMPDYLFGQKPSCGNGFLIGFEKELPVDEIINISTQLFYESGVSRNPINGNIFPLAKLLWEYWDGGSWRPIILQSDETLGFIKDGYIQFTISSKMGAEQIGVSYQKLYWMKGTLLESNYDLSPRIAQITLNTIQVIQRDTQSEVLYCETKDTDTDIFLQKTYLSVYGNIEVQLRQMDGLWEKWENVLVESENSRDKSKLTLLPNEEGIIPNYKANDIRAVCKNDVDERYIIADGTGLPMQTYEIKFENIVEDEFLIQVGINQGGKILWQDWFKNEDLMTNTSEDLCFQIDIKKDLIKFGDGKNGAIPIKGIGNIRIISVASSLGVKGNVKSGEINSIITNDALVMESLENIHITNKKYAEGGENLETIDEAVLRFRKDFSKVSRAITKEDYETLALNTPGLIIQKAHAIPNYKKGKGYLDDKEDSNCITLVVKAYSDRTPQSDLNEAYLENIKRHINKYRLVTTEVDIIPPCYIGIDVFCMVQAKPYYKDVKDILSDFLKKEFDGISGKRNFGQDIEYGDIYGKIESLNCVKRVIGLSIDTRDLAAAKKPGGGIRIPPDGLTYLHSLEIDIKE